MADMPSETENMCQPDYSGPSLENSAVGSGLRRRGRNASACSQCHARKQKCNGNQPCLNCIRRGVRHLCSGPPAQNQRPVLRNQKQSSRSSQFTSIAQPNLLAVENEQATNGRRQSTLPRFRLQIGQLWRSRGAPGFYGTSYFGPQVTASMLDSPVPDIPAGIGSSLKTSNARPFRDASGHFSEVWELLGLLPRQKTTVDRLVERFFLDTNDKIDAVHQKSFKKSYIQFWERKTGFDDVTTVDLRWLALLFIILAIGAYLDCPQISSPETQQDYEEASLRFYWASRRAIVIAPSFYGESTDLVRAGILVTRYLIQTQRLVESWLTVGFAARIGIAQGLHVDGEKWGLSRRSTETRRRLCCHLYALDRMVSLALGRPSLISDAQSLLEEPQNVYIDDLTDDEARSVEPQPPNNPTISMMAIFEYRLAKVIGQIQEVCFHFHAAPYRDVLALDEKLLGWKSSLPPYFALKNPDLSLDVTYGFLKWQRLYLHTCFHFARIALHRPYILLSSMTDRYQFSREVCRSSAYADLKIRLDHHSSDLGEHYTWCLAAHQLFNSAIILGILAIREAKSFQTSGIIGDLEAYCEMQRSEMWLSEFGLAEVTVVEMCVTKLKQQFRSARDRDIEARQQSPAAPAQAPHMQGTGTTPMIPHETTNVEHVEPQMIVPMSPTTSDISSSRQDQMFYSLFPGFTDLQTWQELIDSIDLQYEM